MRAHEFITETPAYPEVPTYYFAYGMLCDPNIMEGADLIGVGQLKNFKYEMFRYANVLPDNGSTVSGCLWQITNEFLSQLDRIEGYPYLYDRKTVPVYVDGQKYVAHVYTMTPGTRDEMTGTYPSNDYIHRIEKGYDNAGVPFEQLDAALTALETMNEEADQSTKPIIKVVAPASLEPFEFEQIVDLISSGGEVASNLIESGISRAKLISFATVDNKIVSVAVIKTPLNTYRDRVFSKAGMTDLASKYDAEVGYSYTDPSYRTGGSITFATHLQLFSKYNGPLFATVRSDNRAPLMLLQRDGFTKLGEPYNSDRGAYTIELLVKG